MNPTVKTKNTGSQERLASHTPGPWQWTDKFLLGNGAHVLVAGAQRDGQLYVGVNGPDAHLIAAAPDLLAALEFLMDDYARIYSSLFYVDPWGYKNTPQYVAASAAIAKARGGER